MSDDELRVLCKEWQERLGLRDWAVKARYARHFELDDDREGECEAEPPRREATIRILDPGDYPDDRILPQDVECTLVHELLHLHFGPFYVSEPSLMRTLQEQVINAIATALVAAKRGSTGVAARWT